MKPTMTITAGIADGGYTVASSTTLTFTSTEPTSDFVVGDITINNGTLSNFQHTDAEVNEGHKIFTATLTFNQTTPPITHTINVNAGAYTNSKTSIGCQNIAAPQYSIIWSEVSTEGYFVILYTQSINNFRGDYQIDNIYMGNTGTTYSDPGVQGWTASKHIGNFTSITESDWNSWTWVQPPTGGHLGSAAGDGWHRYNTAPPSGGTGVSSAPFNTYHLYTETSYSQTKTKVLRSPLQTNISANFDVQWTEAAYGSGMGDRYFYWVRTLPSWSVTQVHYDPNTDQTGSSGTRTGGPFTITI